MTDRDEKDFATALEQLIADTCAAIDSAYMSEDFLESANEAFDKIPIFKSLKQQAEQDGDKTDPA